jgi:hypothetical protein
MLKFAEHTLQTGNAYDPMQDVTQIAELSKRPHYWTELDWTKSRLPHIGYKRNRTAIPYTKKHRST